MGDQSSFEGITRKLQKVKNRKKKIEKKKNVSDLLKY